jgi:hypothetical protein
MRFTSHSISLTILLALLVGHASVAVHAATHESADASECDLCITYNDSSEALATQQEQGVLPSADIRILPTGAVTHPLRPTMSFHQRGPPLVH